MIRLLESKTIWCVWLVEQHFSVSLVVKYPLAHILAIPAHGIRTTRAEEWKKKCRRLFSKYLIGYMFARVSLWQFYTEMVRHASVQLWWRTPRWQSHYEVLQFYACQYTYSRLTAGWWEIECDKRECGRRVYLAQSFWPFFHIIFGHYLKSTRKIVFIWHVCRCFYAFAISTKLFSAKQHSVFVRVLLVGTASKCCWWESANPFDVLLFLWLRWTVVTVHPKLVMIFSLAFGSSGSEAKRNI